MSGTRLLDLEMELREKAAELTLSMLGNEGRYLRESWDSDDDTYTQRALYNRPRSPLTIVPPRTEVLVWDSSDGRYSPYYTTESDLWRNLATVRNLPTFDGGTMGVLGALRSYVLSGEWTAECSEDGQETQLSRECQAVLDRFLDRSEWWEKGQSELTDMARLDGERWIALYPDRSGVAIVEQIAPEYCREPMNRQALNDMLEEPDSTWYFGVHCRLFGHAERPDWARPLGYHFVFSDSGDKWDYLPSWPQPAVLDDCRCAIHIKRNAPTKAARGVSDFYPIASEAEEGYKVGRNVTIGAAIQAAIAMVIQSASPTRTAALNDAAGNAIDTIQRLQANRGTTSQYVQKFNPGTVVRTDNNSTWNPGPMGSSDANNYVEVAKFAAGRCGRRWNMPEAFVTGDPSNAGMASLLVGASPFVKYCEYEQSRLKLTNQYMLWRVLRMAWLQGGWFSGGVSWEELEQRIGIEVVAPQVAPDKPTEADSATKTTRLKTLYDAGVITATTWATMEGVPEVDAEKLAKKRDQAEAPSIVAEPQQTTDAGVRATVGGLQAIAQLQVQYYAGALPQEAAIANAMLLFGFTRAEATALFPEIVPTKLTPDEPQQPAAEAPTMANAQTEPASVAESWQSWWLGYP